MISLQKVTNANDAKSNVMAIIRVKDAFLKVSTAHTIAECDAGALRTLGESAHRHDEYLRH